MGWFSRFGVKKKEAPPFSLNLKAPVGGTIVSMKDLPDPAFAEGMLGSCCGIEPQEDDIVSPTQGRIVQVAETGHAILLDSQGVQILLHLGIDTVEMKGEGFVSHVHVGQEVKSGDLLMTMDREKIRASKHSTLVIVAILNSEELPSVEGTAEETLRTGDPLLRIKTGRPEKS